MRIFLAVIFLAAGLGTSFGQTYSWSTIAGQVGNAGTMDGVNGGAQFNVLAGMSIDAAGNLYVSDHGNQLIRQIKPVGTNWVVSTMIGLPFVFGNADGTNSAGRVNDPYGLGVDSGNNVYVADNFNKAIRQIRPVSTNWVIKRIAGSGSSVVSGSADGTNGAARFLYVTGMTVDSSNNLYVADTLNFTIRKIAPVGTNWVVSTIAGAVGVSDGSDGTNSAGHFVAPSGVGADAAGNIFVADTYGNTIRKLTPVGADWVLTTIAGTTGVSGSTDGTNTQAQFNGPTGVIADNLGNLFITDSGNSTVRKMTLNGGNWITTTIGGSAGSFGFSDGTNAVFNGPNGIAINSNGVLFIEDSNNYVVRQGIQVFAPSIVSISPDVTVTSGAAGNLYVAVSGTAPFSFQWQKAGTNLTDGGLIFGTATTNLYLSSTTPGDAGGYTVLVSNPWGVATSATVNVTIFVPPADSVGDGITDAWRAQYFGGLGNTTNSLSCALCDADGTGQNNLVKFLAGLDPTNSASVFRITSATRSGSDIQLIWQAGGGRTNALESAASVTGNFLSVSGNVFLPGSGDVRTNYTDAGAATNGAMLFYRVRLVP